MSDKNFFPYFKFFLDEYSHPGKNIFVRSDSGEKKIILNPYTPHLGNDGEQLIWIKKKVSIDEKEYPLIVTNYRIFGYDKNMDKVITPIVYPIDCIIDPHKQRYKEAKNDADRGEWMDGEPIRLRDHDEVQIGTITISQNAHSFFKFQLIEPRALQQRIEELSKKIGSN